MERINASFSAVRSGFAPRAASEGARRIMIPAPDRHPRPETQLSELDAKTLLLGDFAENGSWWTGGRSDIRSPERSRTYRNGGEGSHDSAFDLVTLKSPRIEWAEVNEWYDLVINAGKSWMKSLDDLVTSDTSQLRQPGEEELEEIGDEILEAQYHTQRVLLKATESLLKRPGRPLSDPSDLRFLLIILGNPLLYPSNANSRTRERSTSRSRSREQAGSSNPRVNADKRTTPAYSLARNFSRGSSGQHSGIIKRILGLLSNVPNDCHHHLVSWFTRYADNQFKMITDLIGSFVTYRLTRQHGKKREFDQDPTAGLIPNMGAPGRNSSAALHAALGASGQVKKPDGKPKPVVYHDDWQIKAAARVMALLFSANNSILTRRGETRSTGGLETLHSAGLAARERAHSHGQILPISDFYNTLLDYSDLIADFEAWESRRGKFAFCQYPFFLSIWAKIQIMEHDARRQMEVKAREAFFDSIMTHKTVSQYLVLKVRRDCLVEDSLRGVSEVVGTGGEEVKKGLRIEFKGEEGVDAGGLRKEWFLLLVRDVFNPEHGKHHQPPSFSIY
jgi:E3 ubiquitin-protein ligase HECTD2